MGLTDERLRQVIKEARTTLANCGLGAPREGSIVRQDYGMYRLGDDDFLAIGLTWDDDVENITRSAKIQNGVVTDHYIIYGRDKPYFSAQIDPVTQEIICKYRIEPEGYEPKVDPVTGEILQSNFNVTPDKLPQRYLDALEAAGFPYTKRIYCYADKPYGSCVEFGIRWLDYKPPANKIIVPKCEII